MKNTIIKTAKGIGLGMFMALGIAAFTATEANAQYQNRDYRQDRRDDRNDRNRNQLYQIAQREGMRDGQQAGREDRRDRDKYNPQKAKEYKKATNGYVSRFGNKDDYKRIYRQAFVQGYNQAYNRNGRGNNGYGGYYND